MRADIHIVAVAARTPVGLVAEAAAAAIRARISRIEEYELLVTRTGRPIYCGLDARLDPRLLGVERIVPMLRACLDELGGKIGAHLRSSRIPVFLNLAEPRPGWTTEQGTRVVEAAKRGWAPERGELVSAVLFGGHAGGLDCLAGAINELSSGRHELCLVVGVESYIEAMTLDWLDQNRQLAGTGEHRGGMFPGEGAAGLAIASDALVRRAGLSSLGLVRGCGRAVETRLIKSDQDVLGEGLASAIAIALSSLPPSVVVDDIYCDINAERYRSEEWGFALLRVQERLRNGPAYVSASDCWGDMGAASGVLSCVLAVRAWARGYANGPLSLVWGSSEGGLRTAAVIEQPSS